jgi:hypothetical protein
MLHGLLIMVNERMRGGPATIYDVQFQIARENHHLHGDWGNHRLAVRLGNRNHNCLGGIEIMFLEQVGPHTGNERKSFLLSRLDWCLYSFQSLAIDPKLEQKQHSRTYMSLSSRRDVFSHAAIHGCR